METKTPLTFDNDRIYQLMCSTLEELQALRPLGEPYEEGDWVVSDEGDVRCVEYPYPRRGLLKSLRDEGESWLTRPDQLGEIFKPDNPRSQWLFFVTTCLYCWSGEEDGVNEDVMVKFSTPWQLQLDVLAREKWGKKWNGKEWMRV